MGRASCSRPHRRLRGRSPQAVSPSLRQPHRSAHTSTNQWLTIALWFKISCFRYSPAPSRRTLFGLCAAPTAAGCFNALERSSVSRSGPVSGADRTFALGPRAVSDSPLIGSVHLPTPSGVASTGRSRQMHRVGSTHLRQVPAFPARLGVWAAERWMPDRVRAIW